MRTRLWVVFCHKTADTTTVEVDASLPEAEQRDHALRRWAGQFGGNKTDLNWASQEGVDAFLVPHLGPEVQLYDGPVPLNGEGSPAW